MTFRLIIIPASSCRHRLLGRIQPIFSYTSSPNFTTSSTTFSRFCRESHSHKQDTLQTRKIKQKARKAVFTDSRSTKGAGNSNRYSAQTVEAEVSQPKTNGSFKNENHNFGNNKQYNDKGHNTQHQHSTSSNDQSYKHASRLRYEDLLGSRQHRQHHLYRMRLMQYMRHQEFHKHQQRYQSHSRGRGPGQGNVHHDEWRMWHFWHLTESRKTFVKSLTFGITISCLGIWFSNSRSRHMQQWIDFVEDVMHIKNAIEDAMGITRGMSSIQSRPNYLRTPLASSTMLSPEHMFKDAPILQKPHETFKNIRMFTPEQVELRLGQHQKSFRIVDKAVKRKNNRVSTTDQRLVAGYCTNQLSSNSTNEDDSSQHVIRGENGEIERLFWGVFDGHSGWCCSQKVAKDLAPSVAKELDLVRDPGNTKAIVEAIEQGFLKLDQRIVHDTVRRVLENPSKPLACSSLLPAISGSCALMAYVDIKRRDLYVACAGDSRAVMGVREPLEEGGHVWRAVPLSFDQTGRNQWEVKRLKDEHPGEEDTVLTNSRILGRLEPTRAFGDARYKWSKEIQEKVFKLFPYYRQPYKNLNTPPYVTAKPVVQHQKIQPEDRFLVMATDGLWDKLTSDEVVQLVGDLLDGKTGHDEMTLNGEDINLYRQQGRNAIQTSSSSTLNNNEQQKQELIPPNVTANGPASQIRRFTYRDQANAATHLIRNALGGADDDKLAATLSIPSPMSRIYRDDITVTVVFFGQQDTTVALSDANNSDDLVEIH